jgi:hypothetical protein
LIVTESIATYAAGWGDVVHIAVDDSTFLGNCAAGTFLPQEEANIVIASFFADVFANSTYDAASCTTTPADPPGSK